MELKLGHCRVGFDFGFPAMLAVVLLSGEREFLLQTLLVCLLHECGHGIAMCLTGAGLSAVQLTAAGMQLRTQTAVLSRGRLLCVYLSGPAVNLLLWALFRQYAPETALLHLCMGLFNLLPYRVLDGGAAVRVFVQGQWLRYVCAGLSGMLCIILALLHVHNPLLYLMAGYLLLAEWI